MKPKKMRAEMARRFPGSIVRSSSPGSGSYSVQIEAANGHRLAIMYSQPHQEITPEQVDVMFREFRAKNN